MNYIERIIQWFEDNGQRHSSTVITPTQCRDIAARMRAAYVPPPPKPKPGWCAKPNQHAPDCDCFNLTQPKEDPDDAD
jgi:hypothetical protein